MYTHSGTAVFSVEGKMSICCRNSYKWARYSDASRALELFLFFQFTHTTLTFAKYVYNLKIFFNESVEEFTTDKHNDGCVSIDQCRVEKQFCYR